MQVKTAVIRGGMWQSGAAELRSLHMLLFELLDAELWYVESALLVKWYIFCFF